ncbi:PHD finger protein 23B-like isoform X2 [Denticeps clupeoides]|nr:PHD finger protein 23B-like isoform X2 [Denticeps clupeoides]
MEERLPSSPNPEYTLAQNKTEKAKKKKLDKNLAIPNETKPKKKNKDGSTTKKSSNCKNLNKSPEHSQSPDQILLSSSFSTGTEHPVMGTDGAHGVVLPMSVVHASAEDSVQSQNFSLRHPKPELDPCDGPCLQTKESIEATGSNEERTSNDLALNNGTGLQEVKDEPVDLTTASRTKRLFKEEPTSLAKEQREVKAELLKEEEEERENWEGSEGGSGETDLFRLVMEKLMGGRLAEDQETGYHTDWEGSTPDRGGSDAEQDHHAGDGNTTASSAYETEDTSAINGKMEDEDSWDLITCFCLKPFAGRPMIECSECGTWVHLSCAKIRRNHVPDVFVCQPCRDSKQNIRRSNRARTVPRKRFSD